MRKVIATIIKEWTLLRRDVGGLLLLLLMPAALIIVMALTEDAPFRDYQELRFDLLYADNDHGSLSKEIQEGLKSSKNFHLIDSIDGQPVTEEKLKALLKKGTYESGIVIPKGASEEMVNSANVIANDIGGQMGMESSLPAHSIRKSMKVQVYFDPSAKPTFRNSIKFALDKFVTASYSKMLVQNLSGGDSKASGSDNISQIFKQIGIEEVSLDDFHFKKLYINSVQHNVPAWAIFGMFFIVIPISSNLIRERREGSALRVALIPNVQIAISIGRILFFTAVCTIQFLLMLCIGVWFMPVIGLPSLYIGTHLILLLLVAICIAYAATSYGYLVGAVFKTSNQAMPFASISIVILSAIGGIWVPIELFPKVMQEIAHISPLNWGISAINELILRDGGFNGIIGYLLALILFGTTAWVISIYAGRKQIKN